MGPHLQLPQAQTKVDCPLLHFCIAHLLFYLYQPDEPAAGKPEGQPGTPSAAEPSSAPDGQPSPGFTPGRSSSQVRVR